MKVDLFPFIYECNLPQADRRVNILISMSDLRTLFDGIQHLVSFIEKDDDSLIAVEEFSAKVQKFFTDQGIS